MDVAGIGEEKEPVITTDFLDGFPHGLIRAEDVFPNFGELIRSSLEADRIDTFGHEFGPFDLAAFQFLFERGEELNGIAFGGA